LRFFVIASATRTTDDIEETCRRRSEVATTELLDIGRSLATISRGAIAAAPVPSRCSSGVASCTKMTQGDPLRRRYQHLSRLLVFFVHKSREPLPSCDSCVVQSTVGQSDLLGQLVKRSVRDAHRGGETPPRREPDSAAREVALGSRATRKYCCQSCHPVHD